MNDSAEVCPPPQPPVESISVDELAGMSREDAQAALARTPLVIASRNRFSPYFGKTATAQFIASLHDEQPAIKDEEQPPIYSTDPRASARMLAATHAFMAVLGLELSARQQAFHEAMRDATDQFDAAPLRSGSDEPPAESS